MCIFSHESIEKSLSHNLQEPNSRGDVNAEDGEVIVDSKSFSTQNAQEQEGGIILLEFNKRTSAKGLVKV